MSTQQLSVEESRQKTAALLKAPASELDYITAALLDAEAVEYDKASSAAKWCYGTWLAYGSRNNQPTYEFTFAPGGVLEGLCESKLRGFLYQLGASHEGTGWLCTSQNNNSAILIFRWSDDTAAGR